MPPTPDIEITDGENNDIRKPMMMLPFVGTMCLSESLAFD